MATQATEERNGKGNSRKGVNQNDKKLFDTLDDAKAGRPAGKETWRLFSVTDPTGNARFTWADGSTAALRRAAIADGYVVVDLDRAPTREKVAAMLTALSPEDRKALLTEFKARK